MSEPLFIKYEDKRFRKDTLELISMINDVLEKGRARGYVLTTRQVYYQLVSHFDLPNKKDSYNRVQAAVSDGRIAGLVPWDMIEDRGRTLRGVQTYTGPGEVIKAARNSYKLDLWADQPVRPEVHIEKQALEGVIERICMKLRVDFFAQKGYTSQSAAWEAGRRFARRMRKGQRTVVIHLGDHDPSGVDMTRDNHERLSMFAGFPVPVERIALNMDQVEQYGLPANPDNRPKVGDSRTAAYLERYGDQGWELDALDPGVIEQEIEQAVLRMRDPDRWDARLAEEVDDLRELDEVVEEFGG